MSKKVSAEFSADSELWKIAVMLVPAVSSTLRLTTPEGS